MISGKGKKKIYLATLILLLGLMILNSSVIAGEKPIKATFSHPFSPIVFIGKMAKMLTNGLNEACDGRLIIKEYPAGQLHGTFRAAMEAVPAGEIEMAISNSNVLEAYDKRFDFLSVPNLIEDSEHLQRFMETDVYKSFEEDLAKKQNIKILGWMWSPAKSYVLNSKKPIATPEDWKGLTLRAAPNLPIRNTIAAFGASPIAIDAGEVPSAVAQGVVDGIITVFPSAVDVFRAIDVLPYLTIYYGDWGPPIDGAACIIVNSDWYENEVPDDLKVVIEEEVAQIFKETNKMYKDLEAAALKKYEEAPNTTVTYLTEGQTKVWAKIVDENVTKIFRQDYPAFFDASDATRR